MAWPSQAAGRWAPLTRALTASQQSISEAHYQQRAPAHLEDKDLCTANITLKPRNGFGQRLSKSCWEICPFCCLLKRASIHEGLLFFFFLNNFSYDWNVSVMSASLSWVDWERAPGFLVPYHLWSLSFNLWPMGASDILFHSLSCWLPFSFRLHLNRWVYFRFIISPFQQARMSYFPAHQNLLYNPLKSLYL